MSQSIEVASYLRQAGVADDLPGERKSVLVSQLMDALPVSLDPLTCFTEEVSSMDIDEWSGALEMLRAKAVEVLLPGKYLLYVRASPKAFLVEVTKEGLLDVLFDPAFVFSFAVFTESMRDLLLEDHSGRICALGCFAELLPEGEDRPRH
jgi:hypothetical protein